MIDVICLNTNLTIKDCNDWREYFYNISKLGDVNRIFIVNSEQLKTLSSFILCKIFLQKISPFICFSIICFDI